MLPIYWQSVRTSATFNVQIKNTTTAATRADKDNAKQTLFYGQKQKASAEQNKHTNNNTKQHIHNICKSNATPQNVFRPGLASPSLLLFLYEFHFVLRCFLFCFAFCVVFSFVFLFCFAKPYFYNMWKGAGLCFH